MQPIDTRVVADPSAPGNLESKANSWTAHFAPLPAGASLTTPEGAVSMSPNGSNAGVAPVVSPTSPSTVVYANAWPGVDLTYRVEPNELKEDIVIHAASAPPSFSFNTSTVSFTADQAHPGGLVPAGALGSFIRVLPPQLRGPTGLPMPTPQPA